YGRRRTRCDTSVAATADVTVSLGDTLYQAYDRADHKVVSASPDHPPASAARHEGQATAAGPVWMRQAPPKPERLTLEAILSAAMALADTAGLSDGFVR